MMFLVACQQCHPATSARRESGVAAGPACPDEPWIDIDAGAYMTCGVHSGGCAECWGYEAWAEHDTGPVDTSGSIDDWRDEYPPAASFLAIDIVDAGFDDGSWHGCGITSSGSVTCWGRNDEGQATPPEGAYPEVAVGWHDTCALDAEGMPTCWGGDWPDAAPPTGTSLRTLSCGYNYCGALGADGRPYAWDAYTPEYTEHPDGPFALLSTGYDTCGVRVEGGVECWITWTGEALTLPAAVAGSTPIAISVSDFNAVVLSDGSTLTFFTGDDQLYDDEPAAPVVSVSCSYNGCCGLTDQGLATCWGPEHVHDYFDIPGSYVAG
jgi:hypothetical protein